MSQDIQESIYPRVETTLWESWRPRRQWKYTIRLFSTEEQRKDYYRPEPEGGAIVYAGHYAGTKLVNMIKKICENNEEAILRLGHDVRIVRLIAKTKLENADKDILVDECEDD